MLYMQAFKTTATTANENSVISEKRNELTTQHSADQVVERTKPWKLKREQREADPAWQARKLKKEADPEWQAKCEARKLKREQRKADPEWQAKCEARKLKREQRDADPEWQAKRQARRALAKERKADPEWQAKREARRALAKERKADYQRLAGSWTTVITEDVNLIIDGHNMIDGNRMLKSKLLSELAGLQRSLTCVFDHYPDSTTTATDTIKVIFSKDRIADDVIVEIANDKSLVVTNDRLLAIRLLNLGAKVMRRRDFKPLLKLANQASA